jgi:hypothetical protein
MLLPKHFGRATCGRTSASIDPSQRLAISREAALGMTDRRRQAAWMISAANPLQELNLCVRYACGEDPLAYKEIGLPEQIYCYTLGMRSVLLIIKLPDKMNGNTRGCMFHGPTLQTPQ